MTRASRNQRTNVNSGHVPGSGSQPLNPSAGLFQRLLVVGALFLGLATLLIVNADVLAQRINQPVTKVRMENQWQRISDQEVRAMLAAYMGTGYFDFDVLGVKTTLEQHPWVRQASVKKIWPNSLGLHLREEVAIARWGNNGLLNQYGEIFRPQQTSHLQALPALDGPGDSQIHVMEQYRAINQLFFPAGLRVTSLALSERGSWTLELNDNVRVIAGREDVMGRLDRFLAFYSKHSDSIPEMLAVDLRYDNGLAVQNLEEDLAEVAAR